MKLTEALILTLDQRRLAPIHRDRVVELGGCYLQAGEQVGPMLRALVDPERYIPAGATQVHGIRNEDVEGAPKWPEVASRFKVHLDAEPVVCGYNILGFDSPIINHENARNNLGWEMPYTLDPFVWIYWYHRGLQTKKLGPTCERFGVELPEDRAHTADADAFATGLLLTSMVIEGLFRMMLTRVESAHYSKDKPSLNVLAVSSLPITKPVFIAWALGNIVGRLSMRQTKTT